MMAAVPETGGVSRREIAAIRENEAASAGIASVNLTGAHFTCQGVPPARGRAAMSGSGGATRATNGVQTGSVPRPAP